MANSISTLFSSLNNNGASGLYNINLSEYANIRSGGYHKLLKSYYSDNTTDKTKKAISSISTTGDSTKQLAKVQEESAELKKSAGALSTNGKDSVFKQSTDGSYDTEKILGAVKNFVKDYNDMVDSADNTKSSSINSSIASMQRTTSINSKMLSKIGIKLDGEGKLSINEDTFKKADISNVKSMFNGNGSYGYQMTTQASMVENAAKNEAAKSNTYSATGAYSYNYNSGYLFDSYL